MRVRCLPFLLQIGGSGVLVQAMTYIFVIKPCLLGLPAAHRPDFH
jgi:hypothetical protein